MYCPLDGEVLAEIGLGFLLCQKCGTQFLPSIDSVNDERSLTWLETKEIDSESVS